MVKVAYFDTSALLKKYVIETGSGCAVLYSIAPNTSDFDFLVDVG